MVGVRNRDAWFHAAPEVAGTRRNYSNGEPTSSISSIIFTQVSSIRGK